MLSPETWNFQAPEPQLRIKRETSKENFFDRNVQFNFNHLVCVVVPGTLKIPANTNTKLTDDCDYYKITNLNPCQLIDLQFLSSFVLNGNLSLYSIDRRIDCDDSIAVIQKGLLVLCINKETYQSLGIEGRLSHFNKRTKNRYIVTVDLENLRNLYHKPKYRKIKQCLESLKPVSVIATWDPPHMEICPSSLAKYFSEIGYTVTTCSPRFVSHTSYSLKIPVIDFEAEDTDISDIIEWMGLVAIRGNQTIDETPENYISTYCTPEPHVDVGSLKVLQWSGFFTTRKINELVKELMYGITTKGSEWIAIYVQGFSDSPIAWGSDEHHFYTNGDNGYLFAFNNKNALYCTYRCSTKRYK